MDENTMLGFAQMLMGKFPMLSMIFGILGLLVVVGGAVVAATPSKSDDAAWAKIQSIPLLGTVLKVLMSFSPIAKK